MPETFHSSEQVKVFILYLLEKIGYPLEYNDLASIVLRDGYVDYFDFVKNFHELLEKGHICAVETAAREDEDESGEEPEDDSRLPDENGAESAAAENNNAAEPDGGERAAADPSETAAESLSAGYEPDSDMKVYESASAGEENGDSVPEPVPDSIRQVGMQASYVVTASGRMIARGLSDDLLLAAVREKSYISAMRHLSLEKRGAVWNHSIENNGDGYVFHCSIRDRDGVAFSLDLRADSYSQADRMRMNFEDKPDVVYRGIIAMVTGNVNYLFEK